MGESEEKYWYWLSGIESIRYEKIKKCLELFERPSQVYRAGREMLTKSGIFTEKDIENIVNSIKKSDIEKEYEKLLKKNINFTYVGHNKYPEKLLKYSDKPYVLFYKGELPKSEKSAAIVGSRVCSKYGEQISGNIAYELGKKGISIISGMARGIDKYGHEGCIKSGMKTYAVLGCGADVCYPAENIELYEQIRNCGGLISEYPPGTRAMPWRFPRRNRIISMLSDVIIVVEAKERSGTFITVDYALEYGKDIFAVPGRITDDLSAGCNRLIKSGAYPYTDIEDILEYFGIEKNKNEIKNNIILEKDFEVVYSCLGLYPERVEKIADTTGLNISRVYEILMKLRLRGMAEEVFNGHYIRKI